RSELLTQARAGLPSGNYLPVRARHYAVRVLVVAVGHGAEDLAALADELSMVQLSRPFVKPILLIADLEVEPVRRRGFVYETAVDAATWTAHLSDDGGTYEAYVQRRIAEMISVYDPRHTVIAEPGGPLPEWPFVTTK